jgi:hypothetical protein
MSDIGITTYGEPRWGSKVVGKAMLRKDSQARYYVDNVCVVDMRVVDLFTVLACVDGTTHYVLTAFFQKVDRRAIPNE